MSPSMLSTCIAQVVDDSEPSSAELTDTAFRIDIPTLFAFVSVSPLSFPSALPSSSRCEPCW